MWVGILLGVVIIPLSLLAYTKPDYTKEDKVFGSIQDGQEYRATTTSTMATGNKLIRTGQTTLGSIIVSSSTVGTLIVRNATSTEDTASTTIATLGVLAGNGTYTFDVKLERGLAVVLSSTFAGDYTITYK